MELGKYNVYLENELMFSGDTEDDCHEYLIDSFYEFCGIEDSNKIVPYINDYKLIKDLTSEYNIVEEKEVSKYLSDYKEVNTNEMEKE